MTIEEFETLVDRFGDDLESWPVEARAKARALLAESAAARALLDDARLLRQVMKAPVRAPAGLADRIVTGARQARPAPPPPPRGLLERSLAWVQTVPPRRVAVFLPLCFMAGLAVGLLPSLFPASASLDVPVLLSGMVE